MTEENKATLNAEPTVNPTVTSVEPVVQAPEPAADVAKLQREKEDLASKLAEKDRYISDITTEKATLEARLKQISTPQPTATPVTNEELAKKAKSILETAQLDPETASKELAHLIETTQDTATKNAIERMSANLEPTIQNITYANEVKAKNPDLIELGFEPVISNRASELMRTGKLFKDAVETAVKEVRDKVNKIKSNAPPTPPPAGAQGESGGNKPPEPKAPVKEETVTDEITRRREEARKKGLSL